MNCEVKRDGRVFYNTELKGPFDGCLLEIVYYPNGEMIVEIDDDLTKKVVDSLRLKVENRQSELGEDYLLVTTLGDEVVGTTLFIDEGETFEDEKSQRGDLLNLAAWWLSEAVSPTVKIEGKALLEKDKGQISLVVESMLGKSRMSDFYEGRVIPLSDGTSVQTSFKMDESESGKYARVEVELVKKKDSKESYAGFIEGYVFRDRTKGFVLVVNHWENSDDDYDHTQDLLAFQLRLLNNLLPDEVSVVHNEKLLTMTDEEIEWRTFHWLGF